MRPFVFIVSAALAVALVASAAASSASSAGGADESVPPAFVTFPRLAPDIPTGPGGHLIWTGDGFAPAPFVEPGAPGSPYPQAVRSAGAPALPSVPVNASNDPTGYQGETAAASNGTTIVGGSNSHPLVCPPDPCTVRAYTSTDGGLSYTSSTLPGTWNGTTFLFSSDPAIDFDTAGNYYYAFIGFQGFQPSNSIAVSKSVDGGLSWATPVPVTFNRGARFFDDKDFLAVDRSASAFSGRVYVTWDRTTSTNQILYVSYSSDGGATWSSPIKVDDGNSAPDRLIDAYPAVDQSIGTVYDSWHNYARDVIYVDKSMNGGVTWGTDVAAAATHTGFAEDIGCNGGREQGPAHHLKVGPSGTLHLVYADNIAGKGYDILYTRSTDGAATWSTPLTLNDDAGDAHQYHPTLSVTSTHDGREKVSVSFYDRRDDPGNCLTRVYATESMNGGATWSANVALQTIPSNFDGSRNGPGDYSSSTPFGSLTIPFHSQHLTSGIGAFEIYAFAH